ncbi:hypothetical protein OOT46_22540 [Aquabacterium sp. A7-Y]|uniref:hypothetical protein n=1 Tax=Aquabacterium sp. A7-Y TaxID=1349605 RepID=UPI00223DD480|nr:hypothetical protein [Aquabacterium sp. A7-Y]MCW7540607.1 hypothetical protein [Aquabacterium sp. A7-Y]
MTPETRIEQALGRIETLVDQACDVCDLDPSVPQEVKDCLRQLDEETAAARYEHLLEQDRYSIGDHLESLQALTDLAHQACEQNEAVNPAVDSTLEEARREISALRRELH